jgi:hypothetical protein
MPETNMIKCTAVNCPYAKECARKQGIDPDDINETYYNFWMDCNELTSYQDYIKG